MKILESAENYLEAILMITEEKGFCRSIDVVRKLGFSKPSVSHAMSLLREGGYVTMNEDGWLHLTETGEAIAARIYERHRMLHEWLLELGVPADIAEEDACKLEHDVSEVTFSCLKAHIQKRRQMD